MAGSAKKMGVYAMQTDFSEVKVYFVNQIGECVAVFNEDSPNVAKWIKDHENDTLYESVSGK